MQQVFADPQVAHLGAAVVVDHAQKGPIRVVAQPIKLTRTPAAVVSSQTALGQHNDEVFRQLGFSAEELVALKERKVI
jgi:crotonobetainyl-CoA:carnitine CoA-transferase CaiB-like acyl-CoA transferase